MLGNQRIEIEGRNLDASFWEGNNPQKYRKMATVLAVQMPFGGVVHTPEGDMEFAAGDFIVTDDPVTHCWPVRQGVFRDTHAVDDGGYLVSSKPSLSVAPDPVSEAQRTEIESGVAARDLRVPEGKPVEMVDITGAVNELLCELGFPNGLATRLDPMESMGLAITAARNLALSVGKARGWPACLLPEKHKGERYVHEHGGTWYLPKLPFGQEALNREGMTRGRLHPDEMIVLPPGVGEHGQLGFTPPAE